MLRAELPVQRNRILKRGLLGFMGLAGAGAFVFEGFINPSALSSHLLHGLEISTEPLVGRRTILEALEIGFELERGF